MPISYLLQVTEKTPPAFLVAALDDDVFPVEHSFMFHEAFQDKNIPCEIQTYEIGGHGFRMRKQTLDIGIWTRLPKKG